MDKPMAGKSDPFSTDTTAEKTEDFLGRHFRIILPGGCRAGLPAKGWPSMNNPTISKSQYMEGLRCPKLFWLRRHRAHLAAAPDQQSLHIFDVGHTVGRFARELYPGGHMIPMGSYGRLVIDTETALAQHNSYYYEPAFEAAGLRCRLDIFCCKNGGNAWELKEVKMCSRVKPENIQDVAFQGYCVEQSGYHVDRFSLIYVNTSYILEGKIEPQKFLLEEDITAAVTPEIPRVVTKLKNLLATFEQPDPPAILIGTHCSSPGKCPYWDLCHSQIKEDSVYNLPNGNHRVPELLAAGITRLSDIPTTKDLTSRQVSTVQSAKVLQAVVDVEEIRGFLQKLSYPHFYLDFETIAPCVPTFQGTSPCEKVPFQYSLHVQKERDAELQHYQFLPENKGDPRYPLLKELLVNLGDKGSIIAWNMSFEKSVLQKLVKQFPEFGESISSLQRRFTDLMVPFKNGAVVDYRFCGSASLKKVLPVLCPSLSYDNLAIQHGDDSSLIYQKYVVEAMPELEWARLRPDMLAYCERDTFGMVEILRVLYQFVENTKTKLGGAL
jgi:hypothetical protein